MSSRWLFRSILVAMAVAISFANLAHAEYRVVDMPNNWQQIFPGGLTACARGDEFSFFYHPGNSDEIIIDFVGGGACWNFETCNKETALFIDSVEYLKNRVIEEGFHGIYDHENANNPFKTWSHVVVPYCTGDLHWGDNVKTYFKGDEEVTINHRGANNAKSAMDWALQNSQPNRIFVTGTSAGGFASIYWLPYIKELAPNASVVQFSDGAAGVVVKQAFEESLDAWNVIANAPSWIPALNPSLVNWKDLTMVDLYTEIGRHYPSVMFSQFNTNMDAVQMLFYYVMGAEDPTTWSSKSLEMMRRTSTNIANFKYFVAAGDMHTIIPDDTFYTMSSNNVKLVDWLQNMLDKVDMGNVVCDECDTIGTEESRSMSFATAH